LTSPLCNPQEVPTTPLKRGFRQGAEATVSGSPCGRGRPPWRGRSGRA
jgi:hypothetical protein